MLKNDLILSSYTIPARIVFMGIVVYTFIGAAAAVIVVREVAGMTGMIGFMALNFAVFLPYFFEHKKIGEVT